MRSRLETLMFAVAGAAPFLPYVLRLGAHGVPRFATEGDFAGLETAARLVGTGKVLLGPYSRFGFNHPGPLYFYWLWPFTRLSGTSSTGLFAGALAVAIVSVLTAVAWVRHFAGRAAAFAALVALFVWWSACGNAVAYPWNPAVVTLPLTAFLVGCAFLARGKSAVAPVVVLLGAFAAETHLSTVPLVSVGLVLAFGAFAVGRRRRAKGDERARIVRRHLLLAALVAVVAAAPVVTEQLLSEGGNVTKVAHFFFDRPEPPKPYALALKDWAYGVSWLPDRALDGRMKDDLDVYVLASEAVPAHWTATARHWALVYVAAAIAAACVTFVRRRWDVFALLVTGAGASLLSLLALRAIIGIDYRYLAFWTTAPATVTWLAIVAAAFQEICAAWKRRRLRPKFLVATAVTLTLLLGLRATLLQNTWLARNDFAPSPRPVMAGIYRLLRERSARDGTIPVVHASAGAWWVATSVLLELTRDGMKASVLLRDRWILGRYFPASVSPQRHFYPRVVSTPFRLSRCLELVGAVEDVELWTSPNDVDVCPDPVP